MKTDRYAVFGNPVRHSWSPRIHAAFASQFAADISYQAIEVAESAFDSSVQEFFAGGGSGLNITVPFKRDAFALAEVARPAAVQAGAANTLYLDDQQRLCCDNTDGRGLVNDLTINLQVLLQGAAVLLLGAGGAARSVVGSLLTQQPASLHIANRTAATATTLASQFAEATQLSAASLDSLADLGGFDVVINATSAGLQQEIPDIPLSILREGTVCYDMVYAAEATAFQRWARNAGAARAYDGLGMLVEQAAESYCIWRGDKPDTGPVIADLRAKVKAAD